jgi:hypothetical protein
MRRFRPQNRFWQYPTAITPEVSATAYCHNPPLNRFSVADRRTSAVGIRALNQLDYAGFGQGFDRCIDLLTIFDTRAAVDLAPGRRLFVLRALDELDDLLLVSDILTDIDYEM